MILKYDSSEYHQWRMERINAIHAHYGKEYFRGKKVLEVAAAWGHTGAYFSRILGADVTCTDHYDKWVDVIKQRHPYVKAQVQNLLEPWPFTEPFDVIICMGVLYHLPYDRVEWAFRQVCENCKTDLILETGSMESADAHYAEPSPKPPEQDMWETIGTDYCCPSTSLLERVMNETGFMWMRTGYNEHPSRRMWFGKKGMIL